MRVLVILYEARLVGVRMGVGLPLVVVLVLDVLVIVEDMRVGMRGIRVASLSPP